MGAHPEDAPTPGEILFVRYGNVRAHAVSRDEALELIALRAHQGEGGFVLTPNLEHVAQSQTNLEIADACQRSFLCLADGAPLVYLSRFLGLPVREKVSGSDLFEPLMERCAREGLPVFFLGATVEACEAAGRMLRARFPSLRVAGHDSSTFDLDRDPEQAAAALRRARDCGARVIVGCLPTAKVLMLHRFEAEYRPAVGLGLGSALAFYVGEAERAPAWASRMGLEWLHRLSREPGRLWHRYLVEYWAALPVMGRMVLDRLRGHDLTGTVPLYPGPGREDEGPSEQAGPPTLEADGIADSESVPR